MIQKETTSFDVNSKDGDIESWKVFCLQMMLLQEILRNEMIRRKTFLKALEDSLVSILPRMIDKLCRVWVSLLRVFE